MSKEVTIKDVLSIVEKVQKLTELCYNDSKSNRFVALNDLARKIRACFNAIYLLPLDQYDVLCVPANIMYRCIVSDLMATLFIAVIDDSQFDEVMHIMDVDFAKSLKNSLDANIEIRKETYPEESNDFDELSKNYQIKLYNDLKDCLNSGKGEEWEIKKVKPIFINGIAYTGQIRQMYDILKTYGNEVRTLASVYQYYRLFSQSEHYSLKGRIFNYKQELYENYYNKIQGYVYLIEGYIYKKYCKQDASQPHVPTKDDIQFEVSFSNEEKEYIQQRILLGDVPHYLYKYRSVKSALQFISNQSIYFSNFTEFNDPFESSANYSVDFTPQQYYNSFISAGFSPASATEVTRQIANGTIDGKICLKEAIEEALHSLGYYCMTSKPDNLLMWAHYADSHRGVCFKFDILEDLDSFLAPLPVEYNSDYIVFDALKSNIAELIRRKSEDWSYENEYRIVRSNFHGLKKVKCAALKEIIFGCRVKKEDKEAIMKEASLHGFTNVKYSEAQMDSHAYRLTIDEISESKGE